MIKIVCGVAAGLILLVNYVFEIKYGRLVY